VDPSGTAAIHDRIAGATSVEPVPSIEVGIENVDEDEVDVGDGEGDGELVGVMLLVVIVSLTRVTLPDESVARARSVCDPSA
jgi:hypothetical protein